jgi:hypothetical protein
MTCVSGNGPMSGVIFLYQFLSGRAIIVILSGSLEAANRAELVEHLMRYVDGHSPTLAIGIGTRCQGIQIFYLWEKVNGNIHNNMSQPRQN